MMKRIGLLASAGVVAQAINLALVPIVAGIYGPAIFGEFSQFYSFMQVLIPVAALCLPMAVVQAPHDREALAISSLALGISLFVSVVIGFALLSSLLLTEPLPKAPLTFFTLCLIAIFGALQQVSHQWLVRSERTMSLAIIPVLSALLMNCARLATGLYLDKSYALLVVATVCAYSCQSLITFFLAKSTQKHALPFNLTAPRAQALINKYKSFPLHRAPQVLINTLGKNSPIIAFSILYTPSITGEFALAMSLIAAPPMLIGNAFSSVYYPMITAAILKKQGSWKMLRRGYLALSAICLLVFTPIGLYGTDLFQFFLGAAWTNTGLITQLLIPWFASSLVAKAAIDAIPALKLQKEFLIFEIASSFSRVLCLICCGLISMTPIMTTAIFSAVSTAFYCLLIIAAAIACRRSDT